MRAETLLKQIGKRTCLGRSKETLLACVSVFGSFLLQDMFLNLQVFAFEGQNMTLT